MTKPLVAITGATGFIGTHLCLTLLERGYDVRILARNPAAAQPLINRGASLVAGDLQNSDALSRLVTGATYVIHAAGAVRGASQQAFDEVNVAGTAALVKAVNSLTASPRLLLLSSLAAREPRLSWYAHSKREAEELLREDDSLDWVILRPPAVYGPGDQEMLPIFQWMARGVAPVPGVPSARLSLIHVGDLVAAIIACLESTATRHQLLYACDGKPEGYSWLELTTIASSLWSRRIRLWQVPPWLLNTVAQINIWLCAVTGTAPMLTPPKLRELRHQDWVVGNDALSASTGWEPKIDLKHGLEALKIRQI
ncbi:MAG: NAD-dependent epimerase/dehydratase family protein [Halioglobus sp.]